PGTCLSERDSPFLNCSLLSRYQETTSLLERALAADNSSSEMPCLIWIVTSILRLVVGSYAVTCNRPSWFSSNVTSIGACKGNLGGRCSVALPISSPMVTSLTSYSLTLFSITCTSTIC